MAPSCALHDEDSRRRALEVVARSPVPGQVFDRSGVLVLENEAFRRRFRARRSAGLDVLIDPSPAGRRSAFQAALEGHSRSVPLGAVDQLRVVAVYAPFHIEGEAELTLVRVTYTASRAPGQPAEHAAPTLYPTEESTVVETQLRFIVDHVPQLIFSALPDGYVDFYNRRWHEFVGRSFAETQGAGWIEIIHPDDQQRTWEAWQRTLDTGAPYEVEYRFRRHDGEYRWFLGRAAPMRDASGKTVRWFGSCTDIHEQKRGEAQRSAAVAELERMARSKDEFVARASHELRTPLNAILGWARMQQLDPSVAKRAMEVIERNAKALAVLINDLLDASRIVANKIALAPETVDLTRLVRTTVESIRPAAEAKHLDVRVAMDEAAGPTIGDPDRLRQVIFNLLSNAVKFTPDGGVIEVRTEHVDGKLRVRVSDTGKGIALEELPHVFDRFHHTDAAHGRRDAGLGLGLSIARHLVELHGGDLQAESGGPGAGATFTMTIPAVPALTAAETRRRAGLTDAVRIDGLHTFIVDDDPDARELLCAVLSRAGASCEHSDSVSDAVRRISREPPDIVVTDIAMPERSGFDLVGELRARGYDRPVVALTAFASSEDRARALDAGFDDHIAKPVEPAMLVETVARLTGAAAAPKDSPARRGQHRARGARANARIRVGEQRSGPRRPTEGGKR